MFGAAMPAFIDETVIGKIGMMGNVEWCVHVERSDVRDGDLADDENYWNWTLYVGDSSGSLTAYDEGYWGLSAKAAAEAVEIILGCIDLPPEIAEMVRDADYEELSVDEVRYADKEWDIIPEGHAKAFVPDAVSPWSEEEIAFGAYSVTGSLMACLHVSRSGDDDWDELEGDEFWWHATLYLADGVGGMREADGVSLAAKENATPIEVAKRAVEEYSDLACMRGRSMFIMSRECLDNVEELAREDWKHRTLLCGDNVPGKERGAAQVEDWYADGIEAPGARVRAVDKWVRRFASVHVEKTDDSGLSEPDEVKTMTVSFCLPASSFRATATAKQWLGGPLGGKADYLVFADEDDDDPDRGTTTFDSWDDAYAWVGHAALASGELTRAAAAVLAEALDAFGSDMDPYEYADCAGVPGPEADARTLLDKGSGDYVSRIGEYDIAALKNWEVLAVVALLNDLKSFEALLAAEKGQAKNAALAESLLSASARSATLHMTPEDLMESCEWLCHQYQEVNPLAVAIEFEQGRRLGQHTLKEIAPEVPDKTEGLKVKDLYRAADRCAEIYIA